MNRKIALLVFLALSVNACSIFKSSVCDTAKKVTDAASAVIATGLVCKNQDAIKSDLEGIVEKAGVCKTSVNGMIDLCSIISTGAVNLVFSNGIPAKYECSGGAPKEALQMALEIACKRVLP